MKNKTIVEKSGGGTYLKLNKKAFTLAEALITIAIVGIVAAITIPSLMTKINELVANHQFRAAFSKINQSLRLISSSEDEAIPLCYTGTGISDWSGCVAFYDKLTKNMKVLQVCRGNAYADGCIPHYKGIDAIALDNNPDEDIDSIMNNCGGFSTNNIKTRSIAYVFIDGTIIFT